MRLNILERLFKFLTGQKFTMSIAPVLIAAGISAAGSALSGLSQANAQEEARKRRKAEYDQVIKRALGYQEAGENAFYDSINTPNQYLGQIQRDLNDNTNKALNAGRNQLNASLAQQGIRGGQAATQLARGIGNMATAANQDLNQLNYQDQAQRNNLRSAYEMAKAQAGLNAGLQQFNG